MELYEVDDLTFTRLDSLEGYPKMYSRAQENFITDNGRSYLAWIYYQNSFEGDKIVESGDWVAFQKDEVKRRECDLLAVEK